MITKKCIMYASFDSNGKKLIDSNYSLNLNILEKSGNYLLHKDLLRHFTSRKQSSASTKTRSEVRGGGRKPWRQKGTGRARAGSNRSPLWKGGGVIFGPKPKKKNLKLNRKERHLALRTLLFNKKNISSIIEDLEIINFEPKTKNFLKICKNCDINWHQQTLIIVSKKTGSLKLSTQNLKNIELISASNLNTLSLLKAKKILLTPMAINDIKEIYCECE